MDARELPFYGLGMIAFAMASSDGRIQANERNELHNIVSEWSDNFEQDFDIAEIIFSVLKKTPPMNMKDGYENGMKQIRLGSDHLTPYLKEKFLFLINDIAHAFPPVTDDEKALLEQFEDDLNDIN